VASKRQQQAVMQTADNMRAFCEALRVEAGKEYRVATEGAREVRAVLSHAGHVRAWIVAGNLQLAARMNKFAAGYAIATWLAFLKHFDEEIAEARARTRKTEKAKRPLPADGSFKFGK